MDMPDNRNYFYTEKSGIDNRPEYSYIVEWVSEGANVIDLGCGNGSLLGILKEKKKVSGSGIEITESGVNACLEKGINAKAGRIDVELSDIDSGSFDFAICNVTLQMVMYPEVTLREMKRISKYQIISFPNFAFLLNRLDMLFRGRMPRPMLFGYEWYNTGHIHQLSVLDFCRMLEKIDLQIVKASTFARRRPLRLLSRISSNLFSPGHIFLLSGK